MRMLTITGACTLVLLAGATGIASAAPRGPAIVSPRAAAVFTASHRVPIKVRVPAGGGRLTARVGTRGISRRFGPARAGVRTAQLVVGRDLREGSNILRIQVGRAVRTRQIVVATKRMTGLVRVQRFLRERKGAQCLCARVHFGAKLGVAKHRLVGFEALLNGRAVTNQFWWQGPRQRRALLGARMGLRYGRNTLAALVFDADGHYQRATTSIRVPRTLPLASAGFDRRVRTRRRVRLDGAGSIPARPGERLRYRWRIVAAPKGSHARLRRAGSAHPVLVPNVRGDYRVKLTVRETGHRSGRARPHATAATAASSATAATAASSAPTATAAAMRSVSGGHSRPARRRLPNTAPPPGASRLPTLLPLSNGDPLVTVSPIRATQPLTPPSEMPSQQNSAEVTIAAAPRIPPMGWTIQTNPVPGKGVVLNGTDYAPGGSPQTKGGVQMLVINRITLAVVSDRFFPAGSGTDWQQLSDAVAATNSAQLVVLSGIGEPASFGQSAMNSLGYVMQQLGAAQPSGFGAGMPALQTGRWSVIGRKGFSIGGADEHFAPSGSTAADAGNLSGYLQIDNTGDYVFVYGDYVAFNTSAGNASPQAVSISIGKTAYGSQTLPVGDSGFAVLAFDGYSLAIRAQGTFATNTPQGPDAQGIGQLAALLGRIAANPSWGVVVQSIGKPTVSAPWVRELTPQITRLGGNWNVFNGVNGTGGYALVGGSGATAEAAEQSEPLTGTSGRLEGVLSRDNNDRMVVNQAGVSAPGVTQLMTLAFSRGQAWPDTGTPGDTKATSYIAQQLGLQRWPNVRDAYWQDTNADFGAGLLDHLSSLTYPSGSPPFSESDFDAVQQELVREFRAVSYVRGLIASWQGIFATASTAGLVDLHNVTNNVLDAVKVDGGTGISFDPMELISAITEFAALADVPGGDTALGAFRLASTVATMVTPTGGDVPVTQQITTNADQLGDSLTSTYVQIQAQLDHIGDLLVTNYGKLRVAAGNANGDWAMSTQAKDYIRDGLEISARQLAYEHLVPVAYPYVYDLRATGLNPSGTSAQNYRCVQGGRVVRPFQYTGSGGAFPGISSYDGNGNPIVDANAFSGVPENAWSYDQSGQIAVGVSNFGQVPSLHTTPPGDLMANMFEPLSDGGNVGLYPQYFADHFQQRAVACTSTGQ